MALLEMPPDGERLGHLARGSQSGMLSCPPPPPCGHQGDHGGAVRTSVTRSTMARSSAWDRLAHRLCRDRRRGCDRDVVCASCTAGASRDRGGDMRAGLRSQMRVMDAASDAPNLASVMNIDAFNLGNAIGAAPGRRGDRGGVGFAGGIAGRRGNGGFGTANAVGAAASARRPARLSMPLIYPRACLAHTSLATASRSRQPTA